MSDIDDRDAPAVAERPLERLWAARWPLGAAALVLASAFAAGRLNVWETGLSAALIALASVVAPRRRSLVGLRDQAGRGAIVNPQSLAILAGLPDPVLVLDGRGVVLAFN